MLKEECIEALDMAVKLKGEIRHPQVLAVNLLLAYIHDKDIEDAFYAGGWFKE